MNLDHRVYEMLREMNAIPAGVPFNPIAALERIAKRLLTLHGATLALMEERSGYRALLCGIAWDIGQRGGELAPDEAIIVEWPPDAPEKKPEDAPKVLAPPKGLVSLH